MDNTWSSGSILAAALLGIGALVFLVAPPAGVTDSITTAGGVQEEKQRSVATEEINGLVQTLVPERHRPADLAVRQRLIPAGTATGTSNVYGATWISNNVTFYAGVIFERNKTTELADRRVVVKQELTDGVTMPNSQRIVKQSVRSTAENYLSIRTGNLTCARRVLDGTNLYKCNSYRQTSTNTEIGYTGFVSPYPLTVSVFACKRTQGMERFGSGSC